jgi:Na+-translocating ferredoxin:NAD+ oxidoreductase RnfG subunit
LNRQSRIGPITAGLFAAGIASPTAAYAAVYLTVEQAQASMFPGATFAPSFLTLDAGQAAEIQKRSGQRVANRQLKAWRVSTGGWFLVDQVIGKHEFITYAVGLDAAGAVKQVEILEYRESYGDQVRGAAWRAQFVGKRADARLRLGDDIKNISGATLSSKHVTDGVKRILATHAVALAPAG